MVGYSAGSRNAPSFDWVKNLLRDPSPEEFYALNYDTSSVFALFWNMLRNTIPPFIINNTIECFDRMKIHRMDSNERLPTGRGKYTVTVDDIQVDFHNAELAPPRGVMAINYVRFIHFEHQPHDFALSWTTGRISPN
jgi:hypothetical protein